MPPGVALAQRSPGRPNSLVMPMCCGSSDPCRGRSAVGVGSALEVPREREVVLEREVDHAIGGGRGAPQAVEVIKSAAVPLGSGRGQRSGREPFSGRVSLAGCAWNMSMSVTDMSIAGMAVTVINGDRSAGRQGHAVLQPASQPPIVGTCHWPRPLALAILPRP